VADDNHLAQLRLGVGAWNQWRRLNPDTTPELSGVELEGLQLVGVDLSKADLKNCRFIQCDLTEADLSDSDLQEAEFTSCNCQGATFLEANAQAAQFHLTDLTAATLALANFSKAQLETEELVKADLEYTNLSGALLSGVSLRDATCGETNFAGADLEEADFTNANVFRADLTDANLWAAVGLEMDNCRIVNARLWPYSKDRWSVLRHRYTGPRLAINLLLIALFFLPLVLKGSALWGISELERVALSGGGAMRGVSVSIDCERAESGTLTLNSPSGINNVGCRNLPIWKLLLGVNGPYGHFMPALTIILLLYQCCNFWMTYQVALLRDAEERSGYSPVKSIERNDLDFGKLVPKHLRFAEIIVNRVYWFLTEPFYPELYKVHQLLRFAYWIAFCAFVLRAIEFLTARIILLG
jgi:hypothetical protein